MTFLVTHTYQALFAIQLDLNLFLGSSALVKIRSCSSSAAVDWVNEGERISMEAAVVFCKK